VQGIRPRPINITLTPDVIVMTATVASSHRPEISAVATVASPTHLASCWILPHRPEAVGTSRRLARAALEEHGIGEDAVDQALLVVSELVTNAVEHACPPVMLSLSVPEADGAVRVEVSDGGPPDEEGAGTSSRASDEHGRGSQIIEVLATAHGEHTDRHEATHWAELPTA
jgi:anti-sigma regulatory factor (Ser/Thr protein kinase)